MAETRSRNDGEDFIASIRSASERVGDGDVGQLATGLFALMARIEAATPGGAPLHAQLDTVRKWSSVLQEPDACARFGGVDHVRAFLQTQLRLTEGALQDYLQAMK